MALTIRDPDYFLTILSSMMLMEPKPSYVFDQFATRGFDIAAGTGDTVQMNRYPYFGDVGMTETDRQLDESTAVGISDPVGQDVNKVTVVLEEYAGPYNDGVASVSPMGVTEKVMRQAQQNILNEDNPADFFNSIGGASLKDDHDRWHDRVLINRYLAATRKWNPGDIADGATTITDKLTHEDLMGIKEVLQNNNAPTYADGLYYAVLDPRTEKHLRQDPDFRESMRYYNPTQLMRGEIGIYEGFRFFGSTNIPTTTINLLTAYQSTFFGPSAIGYAEGAIPLQVRQNKNDDYERFMYLLWLVNRGYVTLDDRFMVTARTYAV